MSVRVTPRHARAPRRARRRFSALLLAVLTLSTTVTTQLAVPAPAPAATRHAAPRHAQPREGPHPRTRQGRHRRGTRHRPRHHRTRRLCARPKPGQAACHAILVTDLPAPRAGAGRPAGYSPGLLRAAYGLSTAAPVDGTSQTVAVVDAYDDPLIDSDLAIYRSTFGLPPCRGATGCLTRMGQDGTGLLPRPDPGWAGETTLDLDMVSAICPRCRLLLVEASSPRDADLAAAEQTAAAAGATVISNSFGGAEQPDDLSGPLAEAYHHPGVAITASSGDDGYGAQFPASSPYVTAVGGTTLQPNTDGSWSESAWPGGGSGCAPGNPKPAWQRFLPDLLCPGRAVVDVAADADPDTGVAVYDSYRNTGWMVAGGTSAAAPLIAGVYALAGNATAAHGANQPYANPSALHDITTGGNGTCGTLLCRAGIGYDGPTGLGSPDGLAAF